MRSDGVVVVGVGAQYSTQMRHTKDDDVVQASAANGPNQPFGKTVLPCRSWRNWFVPDAHGSRSSGHNGAKGDASVLIM
jgi:hypothetical protein